MSEKEEITIAQEKSKRSKPETLKTVYLRNGFYWAQYKTLIVANVIAFALLVGGTYFMYYFVGFVPPNTYVHTTTDYKVLASPDLAEEFLPEGDAIQTATNALRAVYTYDFFNWESQLTSAQKWFTIPGWNAFASALTESGQVKTVVKNGYISSVKIMEAPYVKEKGIMPGENGKPRFMWVVEFPKIEVSYKGSGTQQGLTFWYNVRVDVVRAPLSTTVDGSLVNAIRAKEIIAPRKGN